MYVILVVASCQSLLGVIADGPLQHGHGHGLGGAGTGAGLGAGAGAGLRAGAGAGRGPNFGEEHSTVRHHITLSPHHHANNVLTIPRLSTEETDPSTTELDPSTKRPTSTNRPVLEVPRLQERPTLIDSMLHLLALVARGVRQMSGHLLMSNTMILTERVPVELVVL